VGAHGEKGGTLSAKIALRSEATNWLAYDMTLTAPQPWISPFRQFFRTEPDFKVSHPIKNANPLVRDRGYTGSVAHLRRAVARLRPRRTEAFLRL